MAPELAPDHPEAILAGLGLTLPQMSVPKANYAKAVRTGDLLFISNHGAHVDGKQAFVGKLGRELDVPQGQEAARAVALNMLATIKHHLGDLDRVTRILKLLVFVNSDPTFVETPYVADGASDLFDAVFGPDRATHARSAVGANALPFGMAVDIEAVLSVR